MKQGTKELETLVLTAAFDQLVAAGFSLAVHHGEDGPAVVTVTDRAAALAQCFHADEEIVVVYKGGRPFGRLFLVHGNDGWDVISDNSTVLEPFLTEATKESDMLADLNS